MTITDKKSKKDDVRLAPLTPLSLYDVPPFRLAVISLAPFMLDGTKAIVRSLSNDRRLRDSVRS